MANYLIQKGDTLSKIAKAYGTTVADLAKANSIANPNLIYAGANLIIPEKSPTATPPATGNAGAGTGGNQGGNSNSTSPQDSTPEDILYLSPDEQAILDAQKKKQSIYPTEAPDENKVYSDTLAKFQAEIDALDRLYAKKKADITTQYAETGKKRLGAQSAILANAGMLGQISGESQAAELEKANSDELQSAIDKEDAELQAAKASIMSNVRTMADTSYQNKLKAYSEGADAIVSYLKDATTVRKNNTAQTVKNALLKGVALTDAKDQYVIDLASKLGITPELLVQTYTDAKVAKDQADAKLKQDQDKAVAEIEKLRLEGQKIQTDIDWTKPLNEAKLAQLNADIAKSYADINKTNTETAQKTGDGSSLKDQALSSAKELLQKFQKNKWAVGGSSMLPVMPGSSAADFIVQFNNVKSLLSLDNVKFLKGQGQVSDAERKLLSEASAKLDRSQSETEFKKSLESIIKALGGDATIFSVVDPNGTTHNFNSQADLDAFKKAAGL